MENRYIKILFLVFCLGLAVSSCEIIDLRSPFISYESVNERFEQSVEWNDTNPFKEITVTDNNYTIFTMGDSHIGETVNFNKFLSDAENENASALVMAGDITTGNEEDFDTFYNEITPTGIPNNTIIYH